MDLSLLGFLRLDFISLSGRRKKKKKEEEERRRRRLHLVIIEPARTAAGKNHVQYIARMLSNLYYFDDEFSGISAVEDMTKQRWKNINIKQLTHMYLCLSQLRLSCM